MDFNSWNIFWGICFGVLGTLIIAGNIHTIWIFFKQRSQKRSYSLLISLAVADLLVGIFAVPFYIKVVVSPGYAWSVISIGADVSTGITSIYTLAVISLERIYAVGWPLRHRIVNYRVYVCAISIPWIIAAIFTTALVLRMLDIIGGEVYLCCLVLIPGIPLITICVANFVVWKKQKTPFRNQNHIKREVKLAMSHNENITFYLASFSNYKYFVSFESHGKCSPYWIRLFCYQNFCSLAIHLWAW